MLPPRGSVGPPRQPRGISEEGSGHASAHAISGDRRRRGRTQRSRRIVDRRSKGQLEHLLRRREDLYTACDAAALHLCDVCVECPAPSRIDSDVVLTTADGASTANGHCTFYMSTHTGLCTYQKGTHALKGFKAVWGVWALAAFVPGHFSVIGKYTIGEHDD